MEDMGSMMICYREQDGSERSMLSATTWQRWAFFRFRPGGEGEDARLGRVGGGGVRLLREPNAS